jgi:aminoglycoside 6'-N-acetyltransferase I
LVEQLTIKVLSKSDLPLLLSADSNVFDNLVDKKYAAEFLDDPRHHLVVALAEGIIIGFVSAVDYVHPDKPPELWINEVGVAEAHQKQGVGKALMKEMLQLGHKLGCKTAWVLTDRNNAPAIGLYKSVSGYVNLGATVMYEFDLFEKG